jgi:hypothetical protein
MSHAPSRGQWAGAAAGAAALAAAYATGRRAGLTRSDLAGSLAPGRPAAGRAAQLALGTLAALPGARASSPARALAAGAALGALASREGRAFSAAAHALAAVVAQRVAARGAPVGAVRPPQSAGRSGTAEHHATCTTGS